MYSQDVSECYIKPSALPEKAKQELHLGGFDLAMLSVHYIQKGLLFNKPKLSNNDQQDPIQVLVQKLKHSLSVTLAHFYPLAGRLATKTQETPHSYVVYVDCINSPGARFVHKKVDLTISDILSPTYVPLVVQSFFDHDRAINHDGHTLSLLTIQVTELIDGVFIGCSINHSLVDGTSYWHFFNTLSEVFMKKTAGENEISRPPIHERWFPDGYGPVFSLPFTHTDQFIARHEAPELKERIFHFSVSALARLKAKANDKCKSQGVTISSLQALSALMWRCVTRIRGLPQDQITKCRLAMNNRSRLDPPLPHNYFGNCIQAASAMTTAGNLLANDFAWAALQLNKAVAEQDHKAVMQSVANWIESPFIYQLGQFFDPCSVMMGSSPRFDMYGNEFGLGKGVAVLSGYANKFDGKVTLYPGHEGRGSIDIELCLLPDFMTAIECDAEFLDGLNNSSVDL